MNPLPYTFKDFPGSSHRMIAAALAGVRGARILDLGAADGYLAALVRRDGNRVTGVEINAESAARARQHCDEVFVADLESAPLPAGEFDWILAADVLEHLRDPENMLRQILGRLRPGGRALLSIPNVANVTVRLALLAGRFNYQERGILDRTHLRFFTRATLRELIGAAGGITDSLEATAIPLPLAFPRWADNPLLLALQAALAMTTRLWPTLLAYQFVVVVRSQSERSPGTNSSGEPA